NVTHDYDYSEPSQISFNITAILNNYCNEDIMYPSTHIVNNNSGIITSTDSINWRYIMGGVNFEYSSYNVTWEITRNISLVPDGTQIFLELHPTRDNCYENCSSNQDYHYEFSMLFGNLDTVTNETIDDEIIENNTVNETINPIANNTENESNIEEEIEPFLDSDRDGVEDSEDKCRGYDDSIDSDLDGIPDACDTFTTVSLESEESISIILISIIVLGLILAILIGILAVGIIKK
ncbi:MAG: hypothetical protein VYE59_05580, partial [Candidatus Thermoplasmatota archaeon]|nr:hypothetical protein [Candidatus Thermoplasmatota archaeon]